MIQKISQTLIFALLVSMAQPAIAAPRQNIFAREKENIQGLSEYIYGDEVEQKLVPVYLLGSVARPGLYHLPLKSDLTTLLAIAGGPTENSNLNSIVIKNEDGNRLEEVDFQRLAYGNGAKSPILGGKDIVFVPTREPLVSSNTLTIVTITATVLATILTGFLVKKELEK